MRKFYPLLIIIFLGLTATTYGQVGAGELRGKISDAKTKEGVPLANIIVLSNGVQAGIGQADFDGNYSVKPLSPGKYDVKVIIIGYQQNLTKGVDVYGSKATYADIALNPTVTEMKEVQVTEYKIPLIAKDQTTTGGQISRDEIKNIASREIGSVASTAAGVQQSDEGKGLNIKGSREEGTVYYIDGVKLRGSQNLPKQALEQVSVITGGVPAQYGDLTGGIISATTRGPSKNYSGGAEIVSSQLTDAFGYNLLGLNLSGPIYIKDKGTAEERPLIGFLVAAEGIYYKDPKPSAVGVYKVKDDVKKSIFDRPLVNSSDGIPKYRSQFLRNSDLVKVSSNDNIASKTINLNAKIDFVPQKNVVFTIGGNGNYVDSRNYDFGNTLINTDNNSQTINTQYNVYARFTQRFPSSEADKNATVKNIYYSIQANFSKNYKIEQDAISKDNLFKYSYVGKFKSYRSNIFTDSVDEVINGHNTRTIFMTGQKIDSILFERQDPNHDNALANYTQQYYEMQGTHRPTGYDEILNNRGLINGVQPDNLYGLYNNIGQGRAGFRFTNNNTYGLTGQLSGDIKNHSIQVGFEFEQRVDRFYANSSTTGTGIWKYMNNLLNSHLVLDTAHRDSARADGAIYRIYNYKPDYKKQSTFDKNLRSKLGVGETTFIDINNYTPEELQSMGGLSLFSASELLNSGNPYVNYFGYDYKGNVLSKDPAFNDFFSNPAASSVGAFRPVYAAGYIQDKFTFKDIIFNLGIRIDRFDANQKVLKDKYSLFALASAENVASIFNNSITVPSNIGSDYAVYVDDAKDPKTVVGYRNKDQWYDANGNELATGKSLQQGGSVKPLLKNRADTTVSADAFTDYTPQISVMPRISFSFPISDMANFFANYDILTSRPTTNLQTSVLNYYFLINDPTGSINNPDLKPEKNINYNLGFKQVISQSSAITITSFYKDMRNNIQQTQVQDAYPVNYTTYENRDFGTIKGFTFGYDLRRTNNVMLKVNYTLQFANGTGSSSTSTSNLTALGLPAILVPLPLNNDQRHNIVSTIDYRYGSGTEYNGPSWGRKIFEEMGANLTIRMGSGTPYSKQTTPTSAADLGGGDIRTRTLAAGTINGSRLPGSMRLDFRLDKNLRVTEKGILNVYVQITNLLDAQNVLSVYSTTGSPDDDGWIKSVNGQQTADKIQGDPNSYRELYRAKVVKPDNYSLPRLIRIGATFDF